MVVDIEHINVQTGSDGDWRQIVIPCVGTCPQQADQVVYAQFLRVIMQQAPMPLGKAK